MEVHPVRADVRLHHVQAQYVVVVVFVALHDILLLLFDRSVVSLVEAVNDEVEQVFALLFSKCRLWQCRIENAVHGHWV
jgi:hypothetical protein